MPSAMYTTGLQEILTGAINVQATDGTIQWMLVTANYTFNKDHLVVDAGGANDPVDHEIVATNYVRGFAGSGRKTAGITIDANLTTDQARLKHANLTWTSLGGAANATVAAAILIKKGAANDTTARLIGYMDFADTLTNGSNFTLNIPTDGIWRINT